MTIDRFIKMSRKFIGIIVWGLRPSALQGMISGPKVIINSIPKSGTNLVQEMLHNFPLLRGVVAQTLTSRMSKELLVKKLRGIKRGQCLPSHLFYNREYENILVEEDIKMIFVIRDFRDAILSHINYVERIDVTHPEHDVFAGLKTLDEKIDVCMKGVPGKLKAWPDLVNSFKGWMASDRVMTVRFEDLIGKYGGGDDERQYALIVKIGEFLNIPNLNVNDIVVSLYNEKGVTFNAPSIGKWKTYFNTSQVEKINFYLGKELEYFGYQI